MLLLKKIKKRFGILMNIIFMLDFSIFFMTHFLDATHCKSTGSGRSQDLNLQPQDHKNSHEDVVANCNKWM